MGFNRTRRVGSRIGIARTPEAITASHEASGATSASGAGLAAGSKTCAALAPERASAAQSRKPKRLTISEER